jgi:hypothetical protein
VDRTFLLLGGAGLVGRQVARRLATLSPDRIVIVALTDREVDAAVGQLSEEFPDVEFIGEAGDVFARSEFRSRRRADILTDPDARETAFADLLGDFNDAYERAWLVDLVRTHQPDVVVDTINTATGIGYQDVYTVAKLAKRDVDLIEAGEDVTAESLAGHVETLILSLSVPQLIRHVRTLSTALEEVGTRLYLKVGTTGTGGMGLNIPYTHSEDRPSVTLMTKTAVAFAHTGLLFLMGRTAGAPIVKEVKPGALIGYAGVTSRPLRERGEAVLRHDARWDDLGDELVLRAGAGEFAERGPIELPMIDTGENGLFSKGEFEAITAPGQMEFVTPEEIADVIVREIGGSPTGFEMMEALDAAVLGPSYRAGVLRADAIAELEALEESTGVRSVAIGQLGPPELSKLLWEAELLKATRGDVPSVLDASPEELSDGIADYLADHLDLAGTITSLGVPILARSGEQILRGPRIRIPEVRTHDSVPISEGNIDAWASKGWVDLRTENMARWQRRFQAMRAHRVRGAEAGSAGFTITAYTSDELRIGTVAAWVLANELGGYRVK